jgi:hypothetical protein
MKKMKIRYDKKTASIEAFFIIYYLLFIFLVLDPCFLFLDACLLVLVTYFVIS